ncbi:CarD family transcriptional regulator [Deinococcus humi]|uniref:CarD family transcriptional regulator n=1 Tax=Deinococcus humi TaxID=662880 RepID=A0A7W8JTG4_9DEIO|nr:CarD family transcriptional regulator [Deinococcus humi]MBB5361653.1 CarD family transcriptional regulator [Deinococcus humi]GGO24378.1 transcriptional regulator [Deinococcus humi]
MKHSTFAPGDRVVLPPYGLGMIRGTCQRPVGEATHEYYEIQFSHTASRAYVPVAAPQSAGMRAALTENDLPELLARLQDSTLDLPHQWAARQRLVTEMLASGNPLELAVLTCKLRHWNVERGLPDLDRQAFRRAIKLLEQEVSGLADHNAVQVQRFLERAWNENPHNE